MQAIDGDKECVGRNQATPRTPAPFCPHLTRVTWTRLFHQNGSVKPPRPMYFMVVPTKGECCDSSLSYLLCSPSHILPCCRRDSTEAGERAVPTSSCLAQALPWWLAVGFLFNAKLYFHLLQLKLFAKALNGMSDFIQVISVTGSR